MLEDTFKEKTILANWESEVEYHQRRLYELIIELEHINYFSKEIYDATWKTLL